CCSIALMYSGVNAESPARRWPSPCFALSSNAWNFGPNFACVCAAGACAIGGGAAGVAGLHATVNTTTVLTTNHTVLDMTYLAAGIKSVERFSGAGPP